MAVNMWSKPSTQKMSSSRNSTQPYNSMIRSSDVQDLLLDKLNSIEQTVGNIKTEHTIAALNTLIVCKRKINQVIEKQLGQDISDSVDESVSIKP